jgi:hypothetical protein
VDDDSPAAEDFFAPGSPFAFVYAAMLGATVGGQVLGIGVDALLGVHSVAAPAACSLLLEAFAAARLGARVAGHPLEARRAAVVSGTYTLALLGVSIPLLGWFALSGQVTAPGDAFTWTPLRAVAVLAAFAAGVPVRWGLMVLFGRRAR